MIRAVSVGIATGAVMAVMVGAAALQGAEGLGPTTMDESALLDALTFRSAGLPFSGPSQDFFAAAVASSHARDGSALWVRRMAAPLEGDTIHYRVCKDLSICFVAVDSPPLGVVPAPVLPPVGFVTLAQVPELPVAPPVPVAGARHVPWALAAIPLLGGIALLDHGHDHSSPPGGEQPGGGGETPGGGGGETPGGGGEQPGGGGEQPGGGGEQPGGGGEQPGGGGESPGGGKTPGTVTPEPWSIFLLGTGLAGVLIAYRRREVAG